MVTTAVFRSAEETLCASAGVSVTREDEPVGLGPAQGAAGAVTLEIDRISTLSESTWRVISRTRCALRLVMVQEMYCVERIRGPCLSCEGGGFRAGGTARAAQQDCARAGSRRRKSWDGCGRSPEAGGQQPRTQAVLGNHTALVGLSRWRVSVKCRGRDGDYVDEVV